MLSRGGKRSGPLRRRVLRRARRVEVRVGVERDGDQQHAPVPALLAEELGSTLVFVRRKIDAEWLYHILQRRARIGEEAKRRWKIERMAITLHRYGAKSCWDYAAAGPYLDERRAEVFLDNCRRFHDGRPLRNVVDKANWF